MNTLTPDPHADLPPAPGAAIRHARPDPAAVAAGAARLREAAAGHGLAAPGVAVLLGSGWSAVSGRVQAPLDLPYAQLPAFPVLGVAGHEGQVRLGQLGTAPVWVLRGRAHAYEHGDASAMAGAVRTLAAAGVHTLVQTNAAGSLRPDWRPGSLMLVRDHLDLVQRSPLAGEAGDDRFVDLRDAYDPGLAASAREAARHLGLDLHEGIYAWRIGPQFETPAEIRMLARLGADAVGMSTVPETILARHAGLRVAALSLFTNLACGLDEEPLSHARTLAAARAASPAGAALVEALAVAAHRGPPPAATVESPGA